MKMQDKTNNISDQGVVLMVRNWQTADKYAVCFTREHGKVRFIAYGARYVRNTAGRLLQPFASLQLEITAGQKIDRLKSCELLRLPQVYDFKEMAYGAVITEITAVLTEDHQPQPEIYELLEQVFLLIKKHNPRLVTAAYILQLLALTGFAPQVESCVVCGRQPEPDEDCYFSPLQGGLVCHECAAGGEEPFSTGTRMLFKQLQQLDFQSPQKFSVRGAHLMELERLLCKFLLFQTDKPLKSLDFLNRMNIS